MRFFEDGSRNGAIIGAAVGVVIDSIVLVANAPEQFSNVEEFIRHGLGELAILGGSAFIGYTWRNMLPENPPRDN